MRTLTIVALSLFFVACSGSNSDTDAGVDAGFSSGGGDAGGGGGGADAGLTDGGTTDAGADEDAGMTDAGTDEDAGMTDAGTDEDAGVTDAGTDEDAGMADAGMSSGLDCTFNADCPAAERCECVDFACTCQFGVRGTGVAGVDPCVDGNDCASSLCVEGNGGLYYCSGQCTSAAQCGPNLPICSNIAFIGQICIRDPNP